MRSALSALALSAAVVSAVGCSDEATPLEPAIPLLDAGAVDAGAKVDSGSVQDASVPADASTVDGGPIADATTPADAAMLDAGLADAGTRADAASSTDAGPIGLLDGGASDAGAPADAGFRDAGADAATDAGAAYSHTIAIDGVNDFTAAETFATSTPGYTFYVAWDATYVYFGASGSDVQTSAAATKWWTVYLASSSTGGSASGVTYRTQQPSLPFPAQWHLRWKTTNDFTGALDWSGSAWADPSLSFAGNVFRGAGNDFVEMRVARAAIGNPSLLRVTSAFLNEAQGGEATYAGAPSATFTDGYDRDYAKALAFTLSQSPATAAVLP